jgi:hypothetical protein
MNQVTPTELPAILQTVAKSEKKNWFKLHYAK